MTHDYYKIKGSLSPTNEFILSADLMDFLYTMELFSRGRRQELLLARKKKQQEFDNGKYPNFLNDTQKIREGQWRLNNTPADLQDRRVEITGPVDRKMIINALNSGAKVFMADFEDSNSPTWDNCINGQVNLYDAVRKTISYNDPLTKKVYQLNPNPAVLIVRPRGWHLDEAHILIDDKPISASLFDALTYLFHNAEHLLSQGTGPYFYLPKLESHLEARLWNDVFQKAEELLNLPKGTIKVTVLIETITAAFEMDEIIYELRDYIVGLNCGRWDYIFSFIKKFSNHEQCLLPDRTQVTMTCHFLNAYVTLLINTCHRRGIHAMGGMAAQIPIKNDEKANQEALQRVDADKRREALAGHDGTWVAHPGLIPVALNAFDEIMQGPNQLSKIPDVSELQAYDLLTVPTGEITEQGVKNNITVALLYLQAWLSGNGCVPIRHLMEDAATAEICRAQLWQWLKFSAPLSSGKQLTVLQLQQWIDEEYSQIMQQQPGLENSRSATLAKRLLERMVFNNHFDDFLTNEAYPYLIGHH